MHEILRCSTCSTIVPVGEEHFYDAGAAWPCPTCGAIIRRWLPVQVNLGDPFEDFSPSLAREQNAQTQANASISEASQVSLAVT